MVKQIFIYILPFPYIFAVPAMATSSTPGRPQDDGLWIFLRNRGVPEESIQKMQQDHVSHRKFVPAGYIHFLNDFLNYIFYISLNFKQFYMYLYILDNHMWFQVFKYFHLSSIPSYNAAWIESHHCYTNIQINIQIIHCFIFCFDMTCFKIMLWDFQCQMYVKYSIPSK